MKIITTDTPDSCRDGLIALLTDSVNNGASVGFIRPLEAGEAESYWISIESSLKEGSRRLLVALHQEQVAGAIQIAFCRKKNGLHRADIEKLMVHTAYRRQGIARQLLSAVEALARDARRTLLVLDTRTGDAASLLYQQCGYQQAGTIPQFVMNHEGEMESTTYYYKLLTE